nr:MAG TPA: hypothetical protein [Bacteriophage sp.]
MNLFRHKVGHHLQLDIVKICYATIQLLLADNNFYELVWTVTTQP